MGTESKALWYETEDVEERKVTNALRGLIATIGAAGATEDPLELICTCLVRHTDSIQFAYYRYDDDETGVIAAVREGVKVFLPPPDVQRKVVSLMQEKTKGGGVAVIRPGQISALVPPALSKKCKRQLGMALQVPVGGEKTAILAVFFNPDFALTDRHRAWFALLG